MLKSVALKSEKKNKTFVIKLFLGSGKKKFELALIIQAEKRRD